MNNHTWAREGTNVNQKKITSNQLRELGIDKSSMGFVDDLDELRNNIPNIVLAKATRDVSFVQNFFKKQTLEKNNIYTMGLGVFQQLQNNPNLGKTKLLKPAPIKFRNVYNPYRGQDLTDKTLLVFRTGGIGDLLFIQPNLIYLKEKYPTCYIKFACGPQYQSMVETWDCIDEVLDLPFKFKHLKESDYHALFEGVIERCRLAEKENAYNLFSNWLGLNLPDELLIPKQNAKQDKIEFCKEKLKEWNVEENNFILMQIRASSPIRTPNPNFFIKLIDKLTDEGHNVILTDSPHQATKVDEFISKLKNKDKVFNFCKHSLSLDYSIALISLSKLVIGTDSAMLHIAASCSVKSYGIYGPFTGEIRLKTYPKCKWVNAKRHCAPCFIHGQRPCVFADKNGFSPCYDKIDIDNLFTEINEFYKD